MGNWMVTQSLRIGAMSQEKTSMSTGLVRCISKQELDFRIRTQQQQVQSLCSPLSDQGTHLVNTGAESEGIQMLSFLSRKKSNVTPGKEVLLPKLELKICRTFLIQLLSLQHLKLLNSLWRSRSLSMPSLTRSCSLTKEIACQAVSGTFRCPEGLL
jgi:hypothetical protein